MLGAVAEFERTLIVERTTAGLAAARARGRNGGRPSVMDVAKLARARRLLGANATLADAAAAIGVSRVTLARHLAGSRTT